MYHGKGKLYQKPVADGTGAGTYFSTAYNVGIYSKSQVQADAWEFIRFLMSEEMQDTSGIPEEEAAAYFNGQKSAEEVSELIQNRVTTCLNE